MRTLPFRIIPALLLVAWALSHADGGEPKGKGEKNGRPAPAKEVNSVERIRSALDQTMAMDFSGISIMEALQHIREVLEMIAAELVEEGKQVPSDVSVSEEPLVAVTV